MSWPSTWLALSSCCCHSEATSCLSPGEAVGPLARGGAGGFREARPGRVFKYAPC